jgi:hypothetical protein
VNDQGPNHRHPNHHFKSNSFWCSLVPIAFGRMVLPMEDLSHVDWPTLVVGIILGIPVAYVIGIFAHIHAIRLRHHLDNRELLKKHKTRQQALLVFNRIRAFREHKRDRYPFYMILASAAVSCVIVASMLILIVFTRHDFTVEFRLIVSLFALISALMALILLAAIFETARQIERFDDYKAEFEKRWGSIEATDPPPRSGSK